MSSTWSWGHSSTRSAHSAMKAKTVSLMGIPWRSRPSRPASRGPRRPPMRGHRNGATGPDSAVDVLPGSGFAPFRVAGGGQPCPRSIGRWLSRCPPQRRRLPKRPPTPCHRTPPRLLRKATLAPAFRPEPRQDPEPGELVTSMARAAVPMRTSPPVAAPVTTSRSRWSARQVRVERIAF